MCVRCLAKIKKISQPFCLRCGESSAQAICADCQPSPIKLEQVYAATFFEDPIQKAIHQFKYEQSFALAYPLAELMCQQWPHLLAAVDLIVPVPLHAQRLQERGYNQSALLGQHLAHYTKVPCSSEALQRTRLTRPQVGLTAKERQTNVQGAFTADPQLVKNRHVLLIDDVCTTGSTLNAAALVLLDQGATTVSAYCLARAR